MEYWDAERNFEKRPKWLIFFIIMILLGAVLFFLAFVVRKRFNAYDQEYFEILDGTLDYYTGHYLEDQNTFLSELDALAETEFKLPDPSAYKDENEWNDHFERLKYSLSKMEEFKVAEVFSTYQKEVNGKLKDIVSRIQEMVDTDSYDTEEVVLLKFTLNRFMDQKIEEMPNLFDELNVEYHFETDENGDTILRYEYTDMVPSIY